MRAPGPLIVTGVLMVKEPGRIVFMMVPLRPLLKLMTLASGRVASRRRIKLEPMKPQPPVTR